MFAYMHIYHNITIFMFIFIYFHVVQHQLSLLVLEGNIRSFVVAFSRSDIQTKDWLCYRQVI